VGRGEHPPGTPVKRRCEGRIGWQRGTYGFVPIICGQSVALQVYVAADGSKHYGCSRHWEKVVQTVKRTVLA
jgi:hypothetical protein